MWRIGGLGLFCWPDDVFLTLVKPRPTQTLNTTPWPELLIFPPPHARTNRTESNRASGGGRPVGVGGMNKRPRDDPSSSVYGSAPKRQYGAGTPRRHRPLTFLVLHTALPGPGLRARRGEARQPGGPVAN
jgi:hypothetical protein